jgi:hypothetical protein
MVGYSSTTFTTEAADQLPIRVVLNWTPGLK